MSNGQSSTPLIPGQSCWIHIPHAYEYLRIKGLWRGEVVSCEPYNQPDGKLVHYNVRAKLTDARLQARDEAMLPWKRREEGTFDKIPLIGDSTYYVYPRGVAVDALIEALLRDNTGLQNQLAVEQQTRTTLERALSLLGGKK